MHGGFSDDYAYIINCINIILTIPVTITTGYYTDKLRKRKHLFGYSIEEYKSPILLYIGYCITIIIAPILWYALSQSNNPWTDWILQLLIGLHFQIIWGCIYFWYIDLLTQEEQTRVSLYGVGYNIGAAVFSGTASLIASALVDVLGSVYGAVCTGLWMSTLGICGLLTVIYVDFYFEFKHSTGTRAAVSGRTRVGYKDHDSDEELSSLKEPNNDEMEYEADDTISAI